MHRKWYERNQLPKVKYNLTDIELRAYLRVSIQKIFRNSPLCVYPSRIGSPTERKALGRCISEHETPCATAPELMKQTVNIRALRLRKSTRERAKAHEHAIYLQGALCPTEKTKHMQRKPFVKSSWTRQRMSKLKSHVKLWKRVTTASKT